MNQKLIGIFGGKGVGKTTLLLQLIKNKLGKNTKALYVNLHDIYFSSNSLMEFAEDYYRRGGEYLVLDDLHKYPEPILELSEIREELPDLNIVFSSSISFTGSKYFSGIADSMQYYSLPGLSFREFLEYKYQLAFPLIQFDELIELNRNPGSMVLNRVRPLQYFEEYLKVGYYPLPGESAFQYIYQLLKDFSNNLEADLAAFFHIDSYSLRKINKLLFEISVSGPLSPNIERLAELTGTTRDSLLKFISFLVDAGLLIRINGKRPSNKPRRLYLNNSNLINAIIPYQDRTNNLYETFLVNQLSHKHTLDIAGDKVLVVDKEYYFKMDWLQGSSGKPIPNGDYYNINEGIDFQSGTRVPLWMFGFLY